MAGLRPAAAVGAAVLGAGALAALAVPRIRRRDTPATEGQVAMEAAAA